MEVKLLGSGVQLLESADTLEVEAQQEGEASIIVEAIYMPGARAR